MTIQLGDSVKIHENVNLYGNGRIGSYTKIAQFVEIGDPHVGYSCKIEAFVYIPPGVHIGDFVFIGPHVCFTNDKDPRAEEFGKKLETVVEDHVAIGANATILPGVTIHSHARVGAGAVVTKDVAAKTTVAGNPARILNQRTT